MGFKKKIVLHGRGVEEHVENDENHLHSVYGMHVNIANKGHGGDGLMQG